MNTRACIIIAKLLQTTLLSYAGMLPFYQLTTVVMVVLLVLPLDYRRETC